jgi:hypothetical protein
MHHLLSSRTSSGQTLTAKMPRTQGCETRSSSTREVNEYGTILEKNYSNMCFVFNHFSFAGGDENVNHPNEQREDSDKIRYYSFLNKNVIRALEFIDHLAAVKEDETPQLTTRCEAS